MTTALAPDRLDLILAELRAIRADLAELRAGGHSGPTGPIGDALAAIEAIFRGRPCTAREISDRASALPNDRLAVPLRRAFGGTDARCLGQHLAALVDGAPGTGYRVERLNGREKAGTLWVVQPNLV